MKECAIMILKWSFSLVYSIFTCYCFQKEKKQTEIADCIQLGDGNAFFHIFLWDIFPLLPCWRPAFLLAGV